MKAIQELESQLAIANKIIATLEEELVLYKQKAVYGRGRGEGW